MTKFFRKIILALFFVSLIACESNHFEKLLRAESLTRDETAQVDILLEKLYQSFCYGKGEEPDWELMHSVFFEGAQFVGEVPEGEPPTPQTIEDFIASWQHSIRDSDSPTIATAERILETKATKIGQLIRVDILFQGSKSNDTSAKKPGLDSLVLASVDGVWKILSFVVQYESKL